MIITGWLLLASLAIAPGQKPDGPGTDLAAAKALYASASFEEALTHLSSIKDGTPTEVIERYRALCLLGLGRTEEAEQALGRIVQLKPFHRLSDADVPPRVVAMFAEVRKRVLPAAARELYASAKARFDAKDHGEAAKGFTTLLALLKDEDLDQDMPDRADLKTLGEGFLSLSTTALLPKETTPVRPPAIAAPDAEPPTSIVYTIENTDVVPPADVERRLPPWDPTNRVMAATARRGILEVIVNERGAVESAILRAPVSPYYDKQLLEAANKWRFKPATKNGTPVKFRRLFAITLQ